MSINKEVEQKEIFDRLNKVSNRAINLLNFVNIYNHTHPFFIHCPVVKGQVIDLEKDDINLQVNINKRHSIHASNIVLDFNLEASECYFDIQNMPEKIKEFMNSKNNVLKIYYSYFRGYLIIKLYTEIPMVNYNNQIFYQKFLLIIKLFKIPYRNQPDSYNTYINLGCYKPLSDIEAIEVLERWCSEAILERM